MYLLFAWPDNESSGGFNDFVGTFDTPKKAVEYVETSRKAQKRLVRLYFENFQVVHIGGSGEYTIVEGNDKEVDDD